MRGIAKPWPPEGVYPDGQAQVSLRHAETAYPAALAGEPDKAPRARSEFESARQAEAPAEDVSGTALPVHLLRTGNHRGLPDAIFRRGLLKYWDGRCAITGLAVPELFRASHIKPWAACDTDAERLDIFNGILVASHLDAAFDAGFIMIANDGTVLVSSILPLDTRSVLGLDRPLKVGGLHHAHERYLPSHRASIFRADAENPRVI